MNEAFLDCLKRERDISVKMAFRSNPAENLRARKIKLIKLFSTAFFYSKKTIEGHRCHFRDEISERPPLSVFFTRYGPNVYFIKQIKSTSDVPQSKPNF